MLYIWRVLRMWDVSECVCVCCGINVNIIFNILYKRAWQRGWTASSWWQFIWNPSKKVREDGGYWGWSLRGSTASGTTYSHFSSCPISAFYSTPTSTLIRQQDDESGFGRKLQLAITRTYFLAPIRPTLSLLLPSITMATSWIDNNIHPISRSGINKYRQLFVIFITSTRSN